MAEERFVLPAPSAARPGRFSLLEVVHLAPGGSFVLLPHGVPHALRRDSAPPPRVLQISAPGGWEHYLEDLFEAGPAVLTDGRLDPAQINPIAAPYDIVYEETPQDHG
ncbi:hypothetical protein [Streptomyces sp. NPDC050548]|uniref:hypothetical protein n=1 Tax=Streptomyces sp. NPDC050548 TaxID=3365629 RepID=UPI00378E4817